MTDPADNTLLGVIRLGDPQPGNFSPLYKGQVLVHGMGYAPDHRTLAVVSIGSNSVTFIDTATNAIRHTAYVGRSPHEAFYTPDGKEVWVTVRGEDYVAVFDAVSFQEKTRIKVAAGPGMQIFSPDGRYGYVCSSFNPETAVISVADHTIVARVKQDSPFCPDIAASPDGNQVWLTLKDIGRTMVFEARPPFAVLKTIDTGPITNHVNFARTARGTFGYVTVGGLNQVKVFRTEDFALVATVDVGRLPHEVAPPGLKRGVKEESPNHSCDIGLRARHKVFQQCRPVTLRGVWWPILEVRPSSHRGRTEYCMQACRGGDDGASRRTPAIAWANQRRGAAERIYGPRRFNGSHRMSSGGQAGRRARPSISGSNDLTVLLEGSQSLDRTTQVGSV